MVGVRSEMSWSSQAGMQRGSLVADLRQRGASRDPVSLCLWDP